MLQYLFFFLVHFFSLVGCHPIMRESNGIGDTKIKHGSIIQLLFYIFLFFMRRNLIKTALWIHLWVENHENLTPEPCIK